MTPYEIGVMLHYYVSADDHPHASSMPPVWAPTLSAFMDEGLLSATDGVNCSTYVITDRGRAFVEALKRVPLPEQRWVITWPSEESER